MDSTKFSVGDYIISEKTLPLHKKTNAGTSKKQEWISAGTPSIVKKVDSEHILIDNFCHSQSTHYIVPIEEQQYFTKCQTEGGYILGLNWYPKGRIRETEFDRRGDVASFEKGFKSIVKNLPDTDMVRGVIHDKLGQLGVSQGSSCDTIDKISNYDLDKIRKEKTKR